MKYNQTLLGVIITLISLLLGYFFTKQSETIIVHDGSLYFSSQTEYIPITTFSYDSIDNKSTKISIELEISNINKVDELLLILERRDINNKRFSWEKKEFELITTTKKPNRIFYHFKYAHDSIISKTNSIKIYLWNKGGNKGILDNYRIILK